MFGLKFFYRKGGWPFPWGDFPGGDCCSKLQIRPFSTSIVFLCTSSGLLPEQSKDFLRERKWCYFQCSGENAMNSRKICIRHKDVSHAVCPVSQTFFLKCSIFSCNSQGVENLTTQSREKYRTQLLPQRALPSCFCSYVNILTQASLCVVMSQRVSTPGWRCPLGTFSAREDSSVRPLTPAGEAWALGLKV